jgi:hypothetical protein
MILTLLGCIRVRTASPKSWSTVEVKTSKCLLSADYARLIKYCKSRLQMLLNYGITPILIFDGAKL